MSFLAPELLVGLALLPIAILSYVWLQRRRARYAVRFTNLALLSNLTPQRPAWRRHVPPALYLAAIAALLVSLGRPTLVMATPREDAAVILAMDVSGSMAATDVAPDRLEAAKAAARSFLEQLPEGIRVGVVSFAAEPVTLVEPTDDRAVVLDAIDRLRGQGGTAMGDAIMRVVDLAEALRKGDDAGAGDGATASPAADPSAAPGPDATQDSTPDATPDPAAGAGDTSLVAGILLSDGANSVGEAEPIDAAERAAEIAVPVYTIALGTPDGRITGRDEFGRPVTIAVPPDTRTLDAIAEITGAASFEAPTAEDLQAVYANLQSRIGSIDREQEVTAAFAAGGLMLVVMGAGLAAAWFGRLP
jgi:Ca-activated chloride channel homolog